MRTGEVHELVDRAVALESCRRDRVSVEVVVGELRRLQDWLDGRQVAAARLVAEVSSFPEKSLADASRTNLRHGEQMLRRADTADQVPEFGVSLDAGRLSGAHVDVLARTLRQVEPDVRDKLIEQGPSLVLIAEHATADDFARTVRAEVRRLERVTDGLDRLERQKRAIRFNSFIDKESGMGRWTVTWDPETMLRLETRIDQQRQAMFHDLQPDGVSERSDRETEVSERVGVACDRSTGTVAGRQTGSDRGHRRDPTRPGRHTCGRLGPACRATGAGARRPLRAGEHVHGGCP